MSLLRRTLAALCVSAAALAPAHAQLLMTLTPDTEETPARVTVTFSAILQNQSPTQTLFLNGVSFDFVGDAGRYLVPDDSIFFSQVPDTLGKVGSADNRFEGTLFGIRPSSSTPPGTYFGTVTILGGTSDNAFLPLRTVAFTLLTSGATGNDAPEPHALLLLSLAGVASFSLGQTRRFSHHCERAPDKE